MTTRYVQSGVDEDGMPTYDLVEDNSDLYGDYGSSETGIGGAGTSYTTRIGANGEVEVVDSTGTPVAGGGGGQNFSAIARSILGSGATAGGIAGLAATLYGALGGNKPSTPPGWHGVINPQGLNATRTQIAQPAYTPYSGQATMGRRQLSDVTLTPTGLAAGAAMPADAPSAGGYSAAAPAAAAAAAPTVVAGAPAAPPAPPALMTAEARAKALASAMGGGYNATSTPASANSVVNTLPLPQYDAAGNTTNGVGKTIMPVTQGIKTAADGGLMGLAHGGSTGQPRYLQGHTDGMADKINTDIDGKQAAKLSHGEFVIPADVVSHLGNGNSDAGANVLYKMMDRVRQARTGNPKQGKQINPEKFMPGGLASLPAYVGGGAVAFPTGGPVLPTTQESNLSSWAGPGVADYITRGTALAQQPYQAYTGPLTAGTSPLQQTAYNAAANLTTPSSIGQAADTAGQAANAMGNSSYTPVGSNFTAAAAQQYMNPYLQASLDPQIAEARRQSQITQMGNNAQAVKAGAFGGSRGALMNTETQRNLGTNLAGITGQGYNTAYNNAQQQFNTDQSRKIGEAQFGTNFGLQALQGATSAANTQGQLGALQNQTGISNLNTQAGLGATQRATEQEGITALHNQFDTEQADPMKKVQFEQSLYQGLPVSTVTGTTATTGMQNANQAIGQGMDLSKAIDSYLNPT